MALPDDFAQERLAFADTAPPGFKASLLHDLERGGRIELDWLAGKVVELGRRLNIPTPANGGVCGARAAPTGAVLNAGRARRFCAAATARSIKMAPAGRAIPTPFRRARDIESHGRVPVALRTGSRGIALSSCDLDAMQEGAMPHRLTRHNRPVSDHLHPLVYAVVAGTALWFVLPAWIFFGGAEYMVLLLAVVSGFFLMAAAIPFVLWRVWLKHHAARENRMSFRDWASGEFETQPGRRKALDAAIEIILPLAAAAAGMTAMGLTFHFTAVGSQI